MEDNLKTISENLVKDLGFKLDIEKVKDKCPEEYNACLKDKALEKMLDNLVKNPSSSKSISLISKMPQSFENIQKCIIDNGLIDF